MELKKGDLVSQNTTRGSIYGVVITPVGKYKGVDVCEVAWTNGRVHIIDIRFLDKINKS